MKKIGFNEHYGLQTAVYNGTKTKTRRTEKCLDQLYAAEKELGEPLEIYQQEITREGIMLRDDAAEIHSDFRFSEQNDWEIIGQKQPRHYALEKRREKWTIFDPYTGIETDIAEETLGQYTGMTDQNGKSIQHQC